MEADLRTGRLNTTDQFEGYNVKEKNIWRAQAENGSEYYISRYAPRGEERELWLYVHSTSGATRIFGAQLVDREGANRYRFDVSWLALDPEVMNEFMTFQASRIPR
ncbi:MAG: hypothetical protein ACTS22_10335 [Phycisphaerales bacterium]